MCAYLKCLFLSLGLSPLGKFLLENTAESPSGNMLMGGILVSTAVPPLWIAKADRSTLLLAKLDLHESFLPSQLARCLFCPCFWLWKNLDWQNFSTDLSLDIMASHECESEWCCLQVLLFIRWGTEQIQFLTPRNRWLLSTKCLIIYLYIINIMYKYSHENVFL